jgi:hypothetical protein
MSAAFAAAVLIFSVATQAQSSVSCVFAQNPPPIEVNPAKVAKWKPN